MNDIRMPRGWRAVPIPDTLAHLPREPKRGFPIPYVAEWEHGSDTLKIMDGYAMAVCDCVIGKGEPYLGAMCPIRQRECMSERKCQVCAQPIPEDEDVYFVGRADLHRFTEPPLHRECARYSVQVCPGIARRPAVGVTVCRAYDLLDQWDVPDPAALARGELEIKHLFEAHNEMPLIMRLGIARGVLTFNVAEPINPTRMTVEEFVA